MDNFLIKILQDYAIFAALCGIAFVVIISIIFPYIIPAFLILLVYWGAKSGDL